MIRLKSIINEINNRLSESEIHPTRAAYWKYLATLDKKSLLNMAGSSHKVHSMGNSTPKGDVIADILSSKFGNDVSREIKLPPYVEPYLAKVKKPKLKENGQNELNDLAVDFLDSMGGQIKDLPNWKADRNYVIHFRELGVDDRTATQIYQLALRMSNE